MIVHDDLFREVVTPHEIQRARAGIFPYRLPQRGKVGYWWRRRWIRIVRHPLRTELRKLRLLMNAEFVENG